ncbi:hypothetical protein RCIA144 [Methanocella arvoryzae MRE50]|uniref:Uncharacterized protein n=1 Tax=Methanocella arvoryzae (strain DSM 22066 / NBRC 105507 / MRE50) TaxID=351160 RepID=Q0W3J0_METAR|nr:hypothetical protein RCIA144 [Methanocella arvoryzae MRE50]
MAVAHCPVISVSCPDGQDKPETPRRPLNLSGCIDSPIQQVLWICGRRRFFGSARSVAKGCGGGRAMTAYRRWRCLGLAKQRKPAAAIAPAGLSLRGCEPGPDGAAPEKPE